MKLRLPSIVAYLRKRNNVVLSHCYSSANVIEPREPHTCNSINKHPPKAIKGTIAYYLELAQSKDNILLFGQLLLFSGQVLCGANITLISAPLYIRTYFSTCIHIFIEGKSKAVPGTVLSTMPCKCMGEWRYHSTHS
jgi:hypothetical protein